MEQSVAALAPVPVVTETGLPLDLLINSLDGRSDTKVFTYEGWTLEAIAGFCAACLVAREDVRIMVIGAHTKSKRGFLEHVAARRGSVENDRIRYWHIDETMHGIIPNMIVTLDCDLYLDMVPLLSRRGSTLWSFSTLGL